MQVAVEEHAHALRPAGLVRYAGLVWGGVAGLVYFLTTCRSIWIGDSGEFALALHSLGIAHPPGYPLFTLLGHVVAGAFPFARPIFAAGLFNVIVATAGVAVIYYLFRRALGAWTAGGLSLIWAFTPIFWAETSGIEVYTLNLLLVAITFLAFEQDRPHKLVLAAYLFGLSLCNHPSSLSLALPLIYVSLRERRWRDWRGIVAAVGLILLAGTVYLYLLVRSQWHPISNWGNPSTLRALIDHMTLKQYSGWVTSSWENLWVTTRLFYSTMLASWWWLGLALTGSGILLGWRVDRERTICALLMMISALALTASHQALDYEPFYLIPSLAALLLVGNNFTWLQTQWRRPLARGGAPIVLFALAAVLLVSNYGSLNRSRYTLAEDYARLILTTAQSGTLFTGGDINSFPTLYLRYAEDFQPEVRAYDRSIRKAALLDTASWLSGRSMDDYYEARNKLIQRTDAPVFLVKYLYLNDPDWMKIEAPAFTDGILYALKEKPAKPAEIPVYPPGFDPGDVFSRQLLVNLDLARSEQALEQSPPDSSAAEAAYRSALGRMKTEPRPEPLNQIGIFFRHVHQHDLAMEAYRAALSRRLATPTQKHNIRVNISNIYKDQANELLAARRFPEAVARFEQALAYDSDNEALQKNIGLLYVRALNDREKALQYLMPYFAKNAGDDEVRKTLEILGAIKRQ